MYPVTHAVIAVAATYAGARAVRTSVPLDYRFAVFGALLPDLIDKPLARIGPHVLSYGETSGHTIGHTLLVSACIIAVGIVLARRGDSRLLLIGLGSLTHLLVDPVLVYPSVLFWPAFGWDFPDSSGIPSSYLRLLDGVLLIAAGVALARSPAFRRVARTFAASGRIGRERVASDA